ncbi:hypothetical protein RF11_04605 [Thelohanellus kitauei]|uniref:Uncharacterized protein n=1 Tax=Thelohanellus kitauei TaxID=669202 RepID=A0A0C2N603_THEKT|nr:hypothetical protein RF11_04605 [Thelohanellus kitauei]
MKINIPPKEIHNVLSSIINEVVCVNPDNITEILKKIRVLYRGKSSETKWETFLAYLNDVWIKKYPIETWNNFNLLKNESNNMFRTNNALLLLNRELNERFTNPHPNLYCFIKIIKEISKKCIEIECIKEGSSRRPQRRYQRIYQLIKSRVLNISLIRLSQSEGLISIDPLSIKLNMSASDFGDAPHLAFFKEQDHPFNEENFFGYFIDAFEMFFSSGMH